MDAGSATAVGEVVVTASRRDTLQHAPVAVTAFTDERRNLLGIENARDITNLTPSMSLQGEYLTLRGVGRYENPGVGVDPGVAVHVDGVYTSSPAYLNQPDFLADRIEVLPGPNSVFGRNNVGGTVNVYSKRPTDDFHADLRAGYTSEDETYEQIAVSGPITDTLKFRLGGAFTHFPNTPDGSQQNLSPGHKDPNTGDSRLYEVQLEWDPNPNFDLWTRYQGYSSDQSGAYGVQTFLGGGVGLNAPYNTGSAADYTTNLFYGLAPNPQFGLAGNSNPSISDQTKVRIDDTGSILLKNDHTFTINAKYNFPFGVLRYIGGYQQYDYYANEDIDYTDRKFLTSPDGRQVPSEYVDTSLQRKKWYSNEAYFSTPDDLPLRATVGVYQYEERYKTNFQVDDPEATYLASPCLTYSDTTPGCTTAAAPNPTYAFYNQTTRLESSNEAVYGSVDYDLTSQVRLSGFIRGNWDHRYGADTFRDIFDLYGIYGDFGEGQIGLDVTPAANSSEGRANYSDWTGKVSAEWHPDNSLTAYATVSKGYKSGGFDLANFVPVLQVKPETLYDYEAGIKKSWGRYLLINGALFYYDYRNLQVPVTEGGTPTTDPVTGVQSRVFQTALLNAQITRTIGLELQGVWSPVKDLHITAVYSYLSSEFVEFTGPSGSVIQDPASIVNEDPTTAKNYTNLKGNTVPQSPRNKISIIPQYVFHFPLTDLSVSATNAWVDSQYYAVFNTPQYKAPSYYNLDFRAVLQPKNSNVTAIFYARNVTDSTQYIYYAPSLNFPVVPQQNYTVYEPRSFGLELQYRF